MLQVQAVQEVQVPKVRARGKADSHKKLRLLKAYDYAPGSRERISPEKRVESLTFHVHKFTKRQFPSDRRKVLVVPCFYEFGVETIGLLFCLPQIIHANPDSYVVAVGWHGRSFLYSKIVDEYWELDERFQWLREYSDAFRNDSRNIGKLEIKLAQFGRVVSGSYMARMCVQYFCVECKHAFVSQNHINTACEKCGGSNLIKPLFGDLGANKSRFLEVPRPSEEKLAIARSWLGDKPVGIFARNRLRYGRNLSPDFYQRLIDSLRSMGYTPVWLGERQSVHACPDKGVFDFTVMPESRDLETTLAVISLCEFTVQFYTASTRLASMVKTPWILFESADQLVGRGQEGMRVILTTDYDKKKIVIANFQSLSENEGRGIEAFERSVRQLESGDFDTVVEMVDNPELVSSNMQKLDYWWRSV